jgi:ABC-2 type transport system ATP-binding protein
VSVLARPAVAGVEVLSLRAGLAVAELLDRLGARRPIALKWPNDLMLDGRKTGGILCEARWQGQALGWVAIGLGVNVTNRPASGLEDAATRLTKNYSGGMRRRLDIAASLVVTPELLFLDEPTTGLDPRSRNQVWDIVRALRAAGTTILLCTQYLDEADQLADGIAVIDKGRVIAEGTPGQLKASVGSATLHVRLLEPDQRPKAEAILAQEVGIVHLEPDPSALSVQCPEPDKGAEAIAALGRAGLGVAAFSLGQPSLDEVFLALTGHTAETQEEEVKA